MEARYLSVSVPKLVAGVYLVLACSSAPAQQVRVLENIDSVDLAFSRDGNWLAAVGDKPPEVRDPNRPLAEAAALVKVWEVQTGRVVFEHADEERATTCLAFSPVGPRLAVGFGRKLQVEAKFDPEVLPPAVPVILWDLPIGKKIRSILHPNSVRCLCFSPDSRTLATGSYARRHALLMLWDAQTGEERSSIQFDRSIQRVAFSPNGDYLAFSASELKNNPDGTSYFDSLVQLRDVKTKKVKISFSGRNMKMPFAFSPDGASFVFAGMDDNTVRIYDFAQDKVVRSFETHNGGLWSMAFGLDPKVLFTVGYDSSDERSGHGTWKAWQIAKGTLLHTIKAHEYPTTCLALSPDGKCLATGAREGKVKLWIIPEVLRRREGK